MWQEGSHPEAIYDEDFARQKIEYIHNNPVKAELVSNAEDWVYSSAGVYAGRANVSADGYHRPVVTSGLGRQYKLPPQHGVQLPPQP